MKHIEITKVKLVEFQELQYYLDRGWRILGEPTQEYEMELNNKHIFKNIYEIGITEDSANNRQQSR